MVNDSTSRNLWSWLLVPIVLIVAVAAWFSFDPGFRNGGSILNVVVDGPRNTFNGWIRNYLLEHPEVIVESMRRLEERQQATVQGEEQNILAARADEIFRAADSPVGGNPDGDVTMVEFFDYNCPYCRRVAPIMIETEDADPKLRIVYKEFPILGPNSTLAAKAALAVHRQGKYPAFHKMLMQDRAVVNEKRVMDAAAALGVDVERMKADMRDPEIEAMIDRNLALATALRINGTPGFVIGERILRGATDLKTLQAMISDARKGQ